MYSPFHRPPVTIRYPINTLQGIRGSGFETEYLVGAGQKKTGQPSGIRRHKADRGAHTIQKQRRQQSYVFMMAIARCGIRAKTRWYASLDQCNTSSRPNVNVVSLNKSIGLVDYKLIKSLHNSYLRTRLPSWALPIGLHHFDLVIALPNI